MTLSTKDTLRKRLDNKLLLRIPCTLKLQLTNLLLQDILTQQSTLSLNSQLLSQCTTQHLMQDARTVSVQNNFQASKKLKLSSTEISSKIFQQQANIYFQALMLLHQSLKSSLILMKIMPERHSSQEEKISKEDSFPKERLLKMVLLPQLLNPRNTSVLPENPWQQMLHRNVLSLLKLLMPSSMLTTHLRKTSVNSSTRSMRPKKHLQLLFKTQELTLIPSSLRQENLLNPDLPLLVHTLILTCPAREAILMELLEPSDISLRMLLLLREKLLLLL